MQGEVQQTPRRGLGVIHLATCKYQSKEYLFVLRLWSHIKQRPSFLQGGKDNSGIRVLLTTSPVLKLMGEHATHWSFGGCKQTCLSGLHSTSKLRLQPVQVKCNAAQCSVSCKFVLTFIICPAAAQVTFLTRPSRIWQNKNCQQGTLLVWQAKTRSRTA